MANNLAAFTPKKYSLKLVEKLWNETLYKKITNTNYEGEIKAAGDRVVVRTGADITLSTYTKGMALVTQDLNPTSEEMIVDQQKYFKFIVDDIDKIQNDVNTIETESAIAKRQIEKTIDTDIFTLWKHVKGENAVGTDYTTGTVAVATSTGVVTGTGTTFTAAMVGAPFKATGHTTYYRVVTYTSATSITIVDMDGVAYTGGTIAGGATYTIKAATAVSLTKTNIYAQIVTLAEKLDEALCPTENRWLVVNAKAKSRLLQAAEFIPAVIPAYENVVIRAQIGMIAGFKVYQSELLDGNTTDGIYLLAGDPSFIAFAMQILDVAVVPSSTDPNSFTSTCKGLVTWGRKVFEGNRARGGYIRATFA